MINDEIERLAVRLKARRAWVDPDLKPFGP